MEWLLKKAKAPKRKAVIDDGMVVPQVLQRLRGFTADETKLEAYHSRNLFEHFLVVGCGCYSNTVSRPEVVYQFPPAEMRRVDPKSPILDLCFPFGFGKDLVLTADRTEGTSLTRYAMSHQHLSFAVPVLGERGELLYLICVHENSLNPFPSFYEHPTPKYFPKAFTKRRCWCFVTAYPYFDFFFKVLYNMLEIEEANQHCGVSDFHTSSSSDGETGGAGGGSARGGGASGSGGGDGWRDYRSLVKSSDVREIDSMPVPPEWSVHNKIILLLNSLTSFTNIDAGSLIESKAANIAWITPPGDWKDRYSEYGTAILFYCLPVAQILNLLSALLLERKVLLVSNNPHVVTAIVLSLISLSHPFLPHGTVIPLVPCNQLSHLLDLRTPFLAGCVLPIAQVRELVVYDDVMIVQIEEKIEWGEEGWEMPKMMEYEVLLKTLSPIARQLFSYSKSIPYWSYPSLSTSTSPSPSLIYSNALLHTVNLLLGDCVKDLRRHFITDIGNCTTTFLKESYITEYSTSSDFFNLFLTTTTFRYHVQKTMERIEKEKKEEKERRKKKQEEKVKVTTHVFNLSNLSASWSADSGPKNIKNNSSSRSRSPSRSVSRSVSRNRAQSEEDPSHSNNDDDNTPIGLSSLKHSHHQRKPSWEGATSLTPRARGPIIQTTTTPKATTTITTTATTITTTTTATTTATGTPHPIGKTLSASRSESEMATISIGTDTTASTAAAAAIAASTPSRHTPRHTPRASPSPSRLSTWKLGSNAASLEQFRRDSARKRAEQLRENGTDTTTVAKKLDFADVDLETNSKGTHHEVTSSGTEHVDEESSSSSYFIESDQSF